MTNYQNRVPRIVFAIKMVFLLLFLYAAVSKLLDFHDFQVQLSNSPILAPVSDLIAWSVPLTEIIVSILLLFPKYDIISLGCSYGLMIGFTTYIILVLYFSDSVPCSCGGVLENMGWGEHIVFNLFFISIALTAIYLKVVYSKDIFYKEDILLRSRIRGSRKPDR